MTNPDYQKQNEDFVSTLTDICTDRGHRAALRRWWSLASRHHALPVLGRLPKGIFDIRRSMVAAIFATHFKEGTTPHRAGGNTVGQAALCLGKRNEKGEHPYDLHFRRLLACSTTEELGPLLNRFVKRLSTSDNGFVSLDYARLLGDLRQFGSNPEAVKTRWALAFWQAPAETSETSTPFPAES